MRDDLDGKVDPTQLKRLFMSTEPWFLVGFEDKVNLLIDGGIPREKIVHVLNNVNLTKALSLKPFEEIERLVNFLSRYGDGVDLIVRHPPILNFDMDGQLIPRVEFLLELSGGDEDATGAVLRKLPTFLKYRVEHLESHLWGPIAAKNLSFYPLPSAPSPASRVPPFLAWPPPQPRPLPSLRLGSPSPSVFQADPPVVANPSRTTSRRPFHGNISPRFTGEERIQSWVAANHPLLGETHGAGAFKLSAVAPPGPRRLQQRRWPGALREIRELGPSRVQLLDTKATTGGFNPTSSSLRVARRPRT
ncbi:hypothetical protein NL676_010903 [Syzygium grande]|nr:hypothetical protein NL676_010903 [Syzygium grande]